MNIKAVGDNSYSSKSSEKQVQFRAIKQVTKGSENTIITDQSLTSPEKKYKDSLGTYNLAHKSTATSNSNAILQNKVVSGLGKNYQIINPMDKGNIRNDSIRSGYDSIKMNESIQNSYRNIETQRLENLSIISSKVSGENTGQTQRVNQEANQQFAYQNQPVVSEKPKKEKKVDDKNRNFWAKNIQKQSEIELKYKN